MVLVLLLGLAACGGDPEDRDDTAAPDRDAAPMPVSALEDAPPVPTVVVIDASGSMATEDAPGQRLQAAKDAVGAVVAGLPIGHEVGIVVYGTSTGGSPAEQGAGCQDVTVAVPLGPLQPRQVAAQLEPLQPSGFTPIGLSLQVAADQLPDSGPRSIVVVSDGSDTCLPDGLGPDPCQIAGALHAADDDLTVSTIGFRAASEPGATEQLDCMAREGGGQHHDAASATLLGSRLAATMNSAWSEEALGARSFRGATIGATVAELQAALGDEVPDVGDSGSAEIPLEGATLQLVDGVVTAIVVTAPGVRTIDGLAVGDTRDDVERVHGETDPDADVLIIPADEGAGTSFHLTLDDDAIMSIRLCACR